MTWASMSRALSQRASQKPSRPRRLIPCPVFSASSRHRCSSFSNVASSTLSFFNGWRSTPGTIPATSQLDWLISMTAISVPAGSRGLRDRLRSFNFCTGCSIGSNQRRWMQYPRRRPPHSISLEAFGRRPSARPAPSLIGPASETLHKDGRTHNEQIFSALPPRAEIDVVTPHNDRLQNVRFDCSWAIA